MRYHIWVASKRKTSLQLMTSAWIEDQGRSKAPAIWNSRSGANKYAEKHIIGKWFMVMQCGGTACGIGSCRKEQEWQQ